MKNKFVAVYDKNNKDCDGCAACALRCPSDAIEMGYKFPKSWPVIDAQKCVGCGKCIKVCDAKAISFTLKGAIKAKILHCYHRRKLIHAIRKERSRKWHYGR